MGTIRKRALSLGLAFAMLSCIIAPQLATVSAEDETRSALSYFEDPDYTSKPMARMWFSDASAGVDDNDTIAKQIEQLAEQGFGGVEVTMLSDSINYTNEEAKEYSWGTDAWVKTLKKLYEAADAVEGGFVVDLTITAHWPPCVNTIDPNDQGASKEISQSFTKITQIDLNHGDISINLPATKTQDGKNAYFLFTDTMIDATVAKVTDVETLSSGEQKLTVDFSSLETIDATAVSGGGYAAGVPDEATALTYGWDYSTVLSTFGNEPTTAELAYMDANELKVHPESMSRKRMADWQDEYSADLSTLQLSGLDDYSDIVVGDYVVVSTFYRGTGQLFNGGTAIVMYNRPYVMDFFDVSGIEVVEQYWEDYLLDVKEDENDVTLRELMKQNGGSVFEDSIEANKTTAFWTADLKDEIIAFYGEDYPYYDIISTIVSGTVTAGSWGSSGATDNLDFSDDDGMEERILQDYNTLLGDLYLEQHVEVANAWANSLGMTYRAQTYDLTGLDIAGASATVDVPEGDNMTKGDGLRRLSAAVNLYDKKHLSMEAITGSPVYRFNWEDVLFELTSNFSYGVNRVILHGSAYSKSLNGYNSDWPGWDPFGNGTSFGEPYTYRQTYWDDMQTVSDYISRNQALLQYSTAKIDVAIVQDQTEAFENSSGNSFQSILNEGYSYNIMSEALLAGENAQDISNGYIYQDGPGYKAVIMDEISTISVEAMETLIAYAKAGIPIISYESNPSVVYGTETSANYDAKVAELYQELLAIEGVVEVGSRDDIPSVLKSNGISGYASYSIDKVETTMYQDQVDGTNYYYIYHNNSNFNGMLASGTAKSNYKDESSAYYQAPIKDAEITLEGNGVPYIIDAQTGDITQVGEYSINSDGSVTVILDELVGGASTIIAIADSDEFPEANAYVTSVSADIQTTRADYEIVRDDNGNPVLRASKLGTYNVTLSTGETVTAIVDNPSDTIDLTDNEWDLRLDSYGPYSPSDAGYESLYVSRGTVLTDIRGIQLSDPSETKITTVDFSLDALSYWGNISASDDIISALGVDYDSLVTNGRMSANNYNSVNAMSLVSGIGYYTTTFDWDGSQGGHLYLSYGNDQITGITVNGDAITTDGDTSAFNNITDTMDIGQYLLDGENTITIKLSSSLYKRAVAEKTGSVGTTSGGMGSGTPIIDNGLVYASVTGYTDITLLNEEPIDPSGTDSSGTDPSTTDPSGTDPSTTDPPDMNSSDTGTTSSASVVSSGSNTGVKTGDIAPFVGIVLILAATAVTVITINKRRIK